MNISSEKYNNINGAQIRDAKELLEVIKADFGDQKVGLIVDVGCGSGNVTKILSEAVPHDRILSSDIDPEMVEYSKDLNKEDATIEFFEQDISLPWEELHPALVSLEGQVDIVWSNRVLHWVHESLRPRAASNMIRLLKPGGRAYINITMATDYNEFLPEEERAANEKLLKIPSRQEQQERWTKYFGEAGLSSLNVEFFSKQWTYEGTENPILGTRVSARNFLATLLPTRLTQDERDDIVDAFADLFVRSWPTPLGEKLIEKVENHHMTYYYGQFRIIGTK